MATAEYARKRRQKLKEQHRCLCCGKQDERTLVGYTRCSACAEKCRQRAKNRIRSRKRRRKVKAPNLSIYEIARLATAEGLSYGKYVTKHREDNIIN